MQIPRDEKEPRNQKLTQKTQCNNEAPVRTLPSFIPIFFTLSPSSYFSCKRCCGTHKSVLLFSYDKTLPRKPGHAAKPRRTNIGWHGHFRNYLGFVHLLFICFSAENICALCIEERKQERHAGRNDYGEASFIRLSKLRFYR